MRKIIGASISQLGLKLVASLCMICYIVSKTILQRGVLNIAQYNSESLLNAMTNGSNVMSVATFAIFLQLLAGVALSIYAFLLVEGFQNTRKYSTYLLNLLLFAFLSEIPYDYAFYGRFFTYENQNPLFALVIGLVMLYSLRMVNKDGKRHIIVCGLVIIASMAWCYILRVEFGLITVLVVAIYYLFRDMHGLRLFLGFVVGLPYITGIFAIYPLYIYNEKRGKNYNKYIFYALYPTVLLVCALLASCTPAVSSVANSEGGNQVVLPKEQEQAEIFVQKIDGIPDDFIKGMDVSSVLSEETAGITYYDENGNEEDVFGILAKSGVNYARIRVWNDPYDSKGNGYGGGNNDVETAGVLGGRAALYGMKSCIDFHYSDFWADPSKQMAPKAWAHMRFSDKVDAIYDFTYESLVKISENGADIGMVQIGNEINYGMAGVTDEDQKMELLASASKAIRDFERDTQKSIQIVLHYTEVDNPSGILKIAKKLDEAEIDYDVFGVSYYRYWHGTFDNLASLLTDINEQYGKKTCVMETSYCFTSLDADGFANSISGELPIEGYPASVQGQANMIRDVMAAAYEGGALGVFYWEGCWIAASDNYESHKDVYEQYGTGWASSYAGKYDKDDAGKYYGGCSWDNQAMFDAKGRALPSLDVFKYVNYGAVGNELQIIEIPAIDIEVQKGTDISMPESVRVYYNDSSITDNVAVKWDVNKLADIDTSKAGNHVVTGETGDGQIVNANVKVASINYVQNSSFEEPDTNMWMVTSKDGINPTDIQNKAADAYSGDKAFHWWSKDKQAFTVEQSIEGLQPGTYFASAFAQGGDVGKDAIIYLYVHILHGDGTEEVQDEAIELAGWVNWKNPRINGINVSEGDIITVGVNVDCAAKGWGTIDDIEFAME